MTRRPTHSLQLLVVTTLFATLSATGSLTSFSAELNHPDAVPRTLDPQQLVEARQWQLRELTPELNAAELLALGLSATYLDELTLADAVAARLAQLLDATPDDTSLRIAWMEVDAMAKLRDAQHQLDAGMSDDGSALRQQGLKILLDAVAMAERQTPDSAAPLQSVHELAGDALLQAGQVQQAAAMYAAALQRNPHRPWALLGAARSHAALNQQAQATAYYTDLLAIWSDDAHPAVQEAQRYLHLP